MKKFIFQTMLLSGALLASCSDDIMEAPVQEDYAKSFVELFGPVHPDQDWNMAAQKSVTVNPGSANEVKIYADNGNGYQLAGHFTNVSGTQTFKFDALEKADKFIVVVGSMSKEVENGGTVDFSAISRSYLNGDFKINETTNLYTKLENYRTFSKDYLVQYLEKQPEGKDARETEGLNINFTAIAGAQPVTVYPVYWNAGFYHEFGIHTYDENDMPTNEVVVWRNKDANSTAVQFRRNNSTAWENPTSHWSGATNSQLAINNAQTVIAEVRSKGFTINLPEGTRFGFFIKAYYKDKGISSDPYNQANLMHKWYSDARFNNNPELGNDGQGHAAFWRNSWTEVKDGQTYQHEQTFLGFEDCNVDPIWSYSGSSQGPVSRFNSDNDYNDLMFVLEPAPTIVNHTRQKWTLAVEDLGTEDDYDFNDIVVTIEHVAGEENTYFTARAAGGTLPVYLCYDGKELGGEFHEYFFDEQKGANGLYPMINTQSVGLAAEKKAFVLNKYFSLTEYGGGYMGGLSIKVGENGQMYEVCPPAPGEAPQMICVPANWKWPKERVRIDNAYPGFTSWANKNEESKPEWGDLYKGGVWYTSGNKNDNLLLHNTFVSE